MLTGQAKTEWVLIDESPYVPFGLTSVKYYRTANADISPITPIGRICAVLNRIGSWIRCSFFRSLRGRE